MSQVMVVNPGKRTRSKSRRSSHKRKAHRTPKQLAASRRNIRKAQAARRRKSGGHRKPRYSVSATVHVRRRAHTANPRRRRRKSSNPRRRHRRAATSNPRRRRYAANPRRRRNPATLSVRGTKQLLPNLKGYKYGLKDVIPAAGGFLTTNMISGAAKVSTGNEWAGFIGGGVYIGLTAAAFKRIKFTKPYAVAWLTGGLVAVVIDLLLTIYRAYTQKPMSGLSADELMGLDPIEQAKTLISKGISDVKELVAAGTSADEAYSRELGLVNERGLEPEAENLDVTIARAQAMAPWLNAQRGVSSDFI